MKNVQLHFVHCHKLPHRSFSFRGKQFPVCARCTGIYIGFLTLPLFTFGLWYINPYVSLMLLLPTIIDGLTQAYMDRESNNFLRFITGLMNGIGQMALSAYVGKQIGLFILKIIS